MMISLILLWHIFTASSQISSTPLSIEPRYPHRSSFRHLDMPLGHSPITCKMPATVAASQASPNRFGWDLSYDSVLERNGVGREAWLRKWTLKYESPAQKIISTWRGEPIVSSFLIEHPAFHAGEHTSLLLIRTENHAYRWFIVEGKYQVDKEPVNTQTYDEAYRSLASWKQSEPLKPEETPPGGIEGYSGFLSLYERGKSRQMLLSLKDFFLFDAENLDEAKPGRLMQVLEPMTTRP